VQDFYGFFFSFKHEFVATKEQENSPSRIDYKKVPVTLFMKIDGERICEENYKLFQKRSFLFPLVMEWKE
jgi:hypothetical protein